MPNTFAYSALLIWPLVTLYFFRTKEIRSAILLSMLAGHMFLPVAVKFNLPGLPDLNKFSIITLSIFFCCIFIKKQKIRFFTLKGVPRLLFFMILSSPFLTALTNKDATDFQPGLAMYDGLSSVFSSFIFMSPFFLGRRFFTTEEEQLLLFKYIVIAALIYSIFILYEIRMSPQLHTKLYGFFPHSFLQQVRGGGFRAVVFMGHGLWVAFFIATSVIAAAVLWRLKIKIPPFKPGTVLLYLIGVLLLSKALASAIYALAALMVLMIFSPKKQARIAVLMAVVVMSYPLLSIEKLFPHDTFVNIATSIGGADRAESLAYRFRNEKILLEKAYEKPLFGWGGWGRSRIYTENGKDISVTDGKWIITYGVYGWFGLIAEFGLIFITLFLALKNLKYGKTYRERYLISSHTLLVSIIFVDQIPNASINPFYWLIIGVLFGRVEALQAESMKFKMRDKGLS